MPSELDVFLEYLQVSGLEHFGAYYGIYRAQVSDNKDPESRGRIKLFCPDVGQKTPLNIWVDPVLPYAGNQHGSSFSARDRRFCLGCIQRGRCFPPQVLLRSMVWNLRFTIPTWL